MRGEEPLPGRIASGEWRTSAALLWQYEAVRAAQRELQAARPRREDDRLRYIDALQHLVDAIEAMEQSGLLTAGLVAKEFTKDIRQLGITARRPGARYQTVAEVKNSEEAARGEH
jgi:hypothetical protein